jgi:hypothetical protein
MYDGKAVGLNSEPLLHGHSQSIEMVDFCGPKAALLRGTLLQAKQFNS